MDRAQSGATTPGQSGPGSDGNEGVLRIPQSSSTAGTSPSDCLVSYPGHSLGGSYPSSEVQSVYFTAPADWAELQGDPLGPYLFIICLDYKIYVYVFLFSFDKRSK